MGEVWKARDTKLGRDVALKILPAAFANRSRPHGTFRARSPSFGFTRSSESRPPFYVSKRPRRSALVLALIDGPPGRPESQQVNPLDEAIHIARQIAEAIEYAHGPGRHSRDLKARPISRSLGRNGEGVDFGLARRSKTNRAGVRARTRRR